MALCMQELVAFWQDKYNWEERQAALNKRFKQFRLPINGIDLHFAHHRSEDPHAVPLLLIHGWPGSFVEFIDVLPLLNNPGGHRRLALVMLRLSAQMLAVMGRCSRAAQQASCWLVSLACCCIHLSGLTLEAPLSWSGVAAALLAPAHCQCLQAPASRPSMW